MCGITGFIGPCPAQQSSAGSPSHSLAQPDGLTDQQYRHTVLTAMTDTITHRGPNDSGHYVDEIAALGHRRLSIIDLANSVQPMVSADGRFILTYNGEIYNFLDLRAELIEAGIEFATNGDTEVILHGYQHWGGQVLLQRLRGMFAFVIWDKQEQVLFGARDHFGIKPLYYGQFGETFLYSSEIKSMLHHPSFEQKLNVDMLKSYLTLQYSGSEETFFKGVFKLPEGHCFIYHRATQTLEIEQYYDEEFVETNTDLATLVDRIDQTVCESVAAHQIADVEVGSFLSSGVDSSYVAAVARPDKTYSIGFGTGQYNESQQAGELAEVIGLNNTAESLDGEEAFAHFSRIQWHLDEPDANPSVVPLYFLARLAARDVRVVLSGEGADELFAGYLGYGVHTKTKAIKVFVRMLQTLPEPMRLAIARFARDKHFPGAWHMYANLARSEDFFIGHAHIFTPEEADAILQPALRDGISVKNLVGRWYKKLRNKPISELKKRQYVDMHQWMPGDILLKADKMTMAHSLELRVPLLDKELMAVAQEVPTKYLISDENTKFAFRQAAARHIPREWYDREKLGFPVPVADWLRDEKFYFLVREIFERDYVKQFFDQEALLTMLDENFAGKNNARRKIWTVFTFLVWYDVYFINGGAKPEVTDIA